MTKNESEISKFSKTSWWDEENPDFSMLHLMNPFRIEYILKITESVKGKAILDAGCGGGILSMPLLRLGANLTGIDANEVAISCAKQKSNNCNLNGNFLTTSIEDFNANQEYDIVLAMDIIEHVSNLELFLQHCIKALKPKGILIISTISDSILAKIFVKYVAEYLLKLVPKETHDTKNFISPQKLDSMVSSLTKLDSTGFCFNPLLKQFFVTKTQFLNYFSSYQKPTG